MSIEPVLLVVTWATKKHHFVDLIFPKCRSVLVEGMMNIEVVACTTVLTAYLLVLHSLLEQAPPRIFQLYKIHLVIRRALTAEYLF